MADDSHIEPRLLSGKDAAAYCGLVPATFSQWVAAGRLPGPLPGTRRWDRKAIDLALDKLSGIETHAAPPEDDVDAAFARWDAENEARKAAELAAEAEWERKYEARKKR
jgi:hypothetical protein